MLTALESVQFSFQSLPDAFKNNSLSYCRPFFINMCFVHSTNVFGNEREGAECMAKASFTRIHVLGHARMSPQRRMFLLRDFNFVLHLTKHTPSLRERLLTAL